jgi:hypothetical protein
MGLLYASLDEHRKVSHVLHEQSLGLFACRAEQLSKGAGFNTSHYFCDAIAVKTFVVKRGAESILFVFAPGASFSWSE